MCNASWSSDRTIDATGDQTVVSLVILSRATIIKISYVPYTIVG